jgi:hypothetical protein
MGSILSTYQSRKLNLNQFDLIDREKIDQQYNVLYLNENKQYSNELNKNLEQAVPPVTAELLSGKQNSQGLYYYINTLNTPTLYNKISLAHISTIAEDLSIRKFAAIKLFQISCGKIKSSL